MSTIFQMHRHRVLESKAQGDQWEFLTCPVCGAVCSRRELARSLSVCPQCGHHFPIGAYYRLSMILDSGSFRELNPRLRAGDPLSFPGYREKLQDFTRATGLNEAVVTAVGTICSHKCVAVEALFTALALRDGFIPATINYRVKDGECDLDIVPNVGRETAIRYALSNSLGFGGHNASLLFKRWEG